MTKNKNKKKKKKKKKNNSAAFSTARLKKNGASGNALL